MKRRQERPELCPPAPDVIFEPDHVLSHFDVQIRDGDDEVCTNGREVPDEGRFPYPGEVEQDEVEDPIRPAQIEDNGLHGHDDAEDRDQFGDSSQGDVVLELEDANACGDRNAGVGYSDVEDEIRDV